jgi:2-dehydropantoate 2-reductase
MLSQQPSWLKNILEDHSTPPKLYAWTAENLDSAEPSEPQPAASPAIESQRIYILGMGNLGRLFASSLSKSPNPPPITLVVHRKELMSQWREGHGIEITRSSGAVDRNKNFDIEWWHEIAPSHGPVREVASGQKLHNLIVTTKASAALPSADRVRRYLGLGSNIAFAQNGMSKLWPPHGSVYASHRYQEGVMPNFLACVVTHGLFSRGPFSSVHASEAGIFIGPALINEASANSLHYLMQQVVASPHLNAVPVSQMDLWIRQLEKLVVNSIINPLTAILRQRNGFLFVEPHPDVVRVIDQLVKEASQVLQALIKHESSNLILAPLPETGNASSEPSAEKGLKEIRGELMQRFSEAQLTDMLNRVGNAVKDNKSSMLQDVETGKQTEIMDFNGWLVDMASFLDQQSHVSTHQKLIDLVERRSIMSPEELSRSLLS